MKKVPGDVAPCYRCDGRIGNLKEAFGYNGAPATKRKWATRTEYYEAL